jgi:hypothetical protein
MNLKKNLFIFFVVTVLHAMLAGPIHASDNDVTRKTLSGLQGVYVIVEELQPNLMKYGAAQKAGLSKEGLKKEIETKLGKAGIKVLTWEQALKAPGMPFLYVNINTHEYEKYWYAYDIRVELQQMVIMAANSKIKSLADTWSINMTGIVNVGTMDKLKESVGILIDRFIFAHQAVNGKR